MGDRAIYSFLIGAGALPFALAAAAALGGIGTLPLAGAPDRLIVTYGFGIVSFLTGIHWATHLLATARAPINLLVLSNIVFLATWIALLSGHMQSAVLTQSIAFALLLAVDFALLRRDVIRLHYFRMRAGATLVAIVSLMSFVKA
jgi:hypothetical protein